MQQANNVTANDVTIAYCIENETRSRNCNHTNQAVTFPVSSSSRLQKYYGWMMSLTVE